MRLSEYPWVVVRLECRLCPRRGQYRLARLAARYGSEIELERLLESIAADCKWMRPGMRIRKYEARCGIRFPDLDLKPPPPDLPLAMAKSRIVRGGG